MDLNITHSVCVVTWHCQRSLFTYSPKLFPVLGPASLSVLQLNRSELVHMRHVMVKIELDSRLQGGQREVDTMMARLEAGRVCVVCTRSVF